jgi:hypothetical protein
VSFPEDDPNHYALYRLFIIARFCARGESGNQARVMHPAWARHVRDQCRALGIAFFLKQWGTYSSNPLVQERGLSPAEAERRDPRSNGKGGALLDGRLHRDFPGEQTIVTARAPAV